MRVLTGLLFSLVTGFCSILAQAESGPDLLDLDLETLLTIQVGPSADASAKGLSVPFAGEQVAKGGRLGILGSYDLMDTPFSTINYTNDFIQNHQAASVGDVLQYDPAVRVARGFGNFQQAYMIRGLPIFSDDMTYNGLYGILPRQYLAAELIERVEVLRGPNSFVNGAAPSVSGCLGGAIDVIPKRASKEDIEQITFGMQSASQTYAATDLSVRSKDGSLGIRFNAVDSHGSTATMGESRGLEMATLGMDYRGATLRVSADLGWQDHQMDATQPSITLASNLRMLPAPDADKSITQHWTFSNERDLFGTLRAEYDFSKNITGWVALGARHGDEDSDLSAFLTVNDVAGDYSANPFTVVHNDTVTTGDIGLRTQLQTGTIQHQITLSGNTYQNDSSNAYTIYSAFNNNIYHPVDSAEPMNTVFAGGDLAHPLVTTSTQTSSYALADAIAFYDSLTLTLGARSQRMQEQNFDYNSGLKVSTYDANRVTPMAAVLYKFSPQVAFYGNYVEGLLKGDIAPPSNAQGIVANAGESLKPYQTRQTEIGLKFESGAIGGSIGVFQIRKPLAGYDSHNALVLTDRQTYRGTEFLAYGKLMSNLKVLGGVSFLNTDMNGKAVIGAPKNQANLGLEWDITSLPGLSVNTHIMHTAEQYADNTNSQKAPAWNRFDLGLRYETKVWHLHRLTLRASLENATDADYWASVGGFPGASYLTLGNPRTLLIYTNINF